MKERMQLDTLAPDAMKAMFELEKHVRRNVDLKLYHLIKLRASVLNGCAFCVDMHTTHALEAGESSRRLFAVSTWRESPFFTKTERVALALTDTVTRMPEGGIPDELWAEAREIWSEEELAHIIMGIVAINAWNRIAVTSHKQPPPLEGEPR